MTSVGTAIPPHSCTTVPVVRDSALGYLYLLSGFTKYNLGAACYTSRKFIRGGLVGIAACCVHDRKQFGRDPVAVGEWKWG